MFSQFKCARPGSVSGAKVLGIVSRLGGSSLTDVLVRDCELRRRIVASVRRSLHFKDHTYALPQSVLKSAVQLSPPPKGSGGVLQGTRVALVARGVRRPVGAAEPVTR